MFIVAGVTHERGFLESCIEEMVAICIYGVFNCCVYYSRTVSRWDSTELKKKHFFAKRFLVNFAQSTYFCLASRR